jgi:outer membrane protein
MRRFLIPLISLIAFATTADADVFGVWAGANDWHYDISGTARYKTGNSANDIDVEDDLGYNDSASGVIYAALEHPIPILPNVRLVYTNIDENANGRLSQSFVYGGTTFLANEAVSSLIQLKQTDITFYYSVLDNIVNLDLGLTAKYIDSKVRITGQTSGTQQADVSGWVPMVYAAVGVDVPLTGLSLGADGSAVGYSGSRFYDFTVHASYETPWRFGFDAGYRRLSFDLDDIDNSFANIKFSGPYAGAYLHF